MFEKFNESARRSLFFARYEASRSNSRAIASEHLLLGLLREADDLLVELLTSLGIEVRELRDELVHSIVPLHRANSSPDPPFADETKRVLAFAVHESDSMGQDYVGCEHLLVGILRVSDCAAARYLIQRGIDLTQVRDEIVRQSQELESQQTAAETSLLTEFSRDLTAQAGKSVFDPLIGRESEVERIIQILCRRTKSNPLLLGEAGVGKTAIVEGLATRIANAAVPMLLAERRILALDLSLLVAGTKYRGQFEERLKGLIKEILSSPEVILFIDEIHSLIGAGSAEGSLDAANILKPALSRGEFTCIGATTLREYRRYLEKDRALSRRFQAVTIQPPDEAETVTILQGLRSRYEEFHGVHFTDEALALAAAHAGRYITDRFFPDKAIDVIDEAGSRVKLRQVTPTSSLRRVKNEIRRIEAKMKGAISRKDFETAVELREEELRQRELLATMQKLQRGLRPEPVNVERADIEEVVAAWTGIPVTTLSEDEAERLRRMESTLQQRVVGQSEAIKALSRAIRRSRLGVTNPNRPIGSFIFLGPSGVGKTEVARQLAAFLFRDVRRLLRFDMSECMEKHTVSRLIGSPPGYVGFEEGGQLSEQVRRNPYSVILLDEIEKAHTDIYNILLQVLEDGRLTDNYGNLVDFTNTLIIMTSNLGSRSLASHGRMGFGSGGEMQVGQVREVVDREMKRHFSPEFLNRIDDVVVFEPLSEQSMLQVAEILLKETIDNLSRQEVHVSYDPEIPGWLLDKCGCDPRAGARPLRKLIRQWVEDAVADYLITHHSQEATVLHVSLSQNQPVVTAPINLKNQLQESP
jgi:ATP-dependent Clp protease ATP-binding subunit ClpC